MSVKFNVVLCFSAFEFNLKSLCSLALALPLFAFFSCILISILKDFHMANRTHCGVPNVLPSISASISDFYPQNTLWRLCIGLDSFPRYLIAIIYYNKYYAPRFDQYKHKSAFVIFIKCAFVFHFIELTSLLMLTYVSSVEIFTVHMISFVLFLISSSLYMMMTIASYHWPRLVNMDAYGIEQQPNDHLSNCLLTSMPSVTVDEINNNNYLQDDLNRHKSEAESFLPRKPAYPTTSPLNVDLSRVKEKLSYQYKLKVFSFYLGSFLISLYFYVRHNRYCEPYIYSFFSFCEYLTVLANIGYHMIIFHDLSLFDSGYKITLLELKRE